MKINTLGNIHHILSRMLQVSLDFEHYRKLKVPQGKCQWIHDLTVSSQPYQLPPNLQYPHTKLPCIGFLAKGYFSELSTKRACIWLLGMGWNLHIFYKSIHFNKRASERLRKATCSIKPLGSNTWTCRLQKQNHRKRGGAGGRGGHYGSRVYLPCHMLAKSYYYDKGNLFFTYTWNTAVNENMKWMKIRKNKWKLSWYKISSIRNRNTNKQGAHYRERGRTERHTHTHTHPPQLKEERGGARWQEIKPNLLKAERKENTNKAIRRVQPRLRPKFTV